MTHIAFIHDGALCTFKGSNKTWMKVCDDNGVGGVVDIYTGKYVATSNLQKYYGLNPEEANETNESIWGFNPPDREVYYCPSEDFSCPYFSTKTGKCMIDGIPWEECDEAIAPDEDE